MSLVALPLNTQSTSKYDYPYHTTSQNIHLTSLPIDILFHILEYAPHLRDTCKQLHYVAEQLDRHKLMNYVRKTFLSPAQDEEFTSFCDESNLINQIRNDDTICEFLSKVSYKVDTRTTHSGKENVSSSKANKQYGSKWASLVSDRAILALLRRDVCFFTNKNIITPLPDEEIETVTHYQPSLSVEPIDIENSSSETSPTTNTTPTTSTSKSNAPWLHITDPSHTPTGTCVFARNVNLLWLDYRTRLAPGYKYQMYLNVKMSNAFSLSPIKFMIQENSLVRQTFQPYPPLQVSAGQHSSLSNGDTYGGTIYLGDIEVLPPPSPPITPEYYMSSPSGPESFSTQDATDSEQEEEEEEHDIGNSDRHSTTTKPKSYKHISLASAARRAAEARDRQLLSQQHSFNRLSQRQQQQLELEQQLEEELESLQGEELIRARRRLLRARFGPGGSGSISGTDSGVATPKRFPTNYSSHSEISNSQANKKRNTRNRYYSSRYTVHDEEVLKIQKAQQQLYLSEQARSRLIPASQWPLIVLQIEDDSVSIDKGIQFNDIMFIQVKEDGTMTKKKKNWSVVDEKEALPKYLQIPHKNRQVRRVFERLNEIKLENMIMSN